MFCMQIRSLLIISCGAKLETVKLKGLQLDITDVDVLELNINTCPGSSSVAHGARVYSQKNDPPHLALYYCSQNDEKLFG